MVPETTGVIGGNGFIGRNLIKDLNAEIAKNEHYQHIINANGNSSKRLADTEALLDFDLSVRSVLESVTTHRFDTYVYLSSCEVYGDLTGDTCEDTHLDVSKMSRYGLSKYLAERVVQKYCSRWLILRLNGVVGPHMKKGPVYDILKSDRLWLNAESQFQFLHTSYISRFIRHAIGRNEIYNLTGPDSVSLLECMNLLGRQVPSNNDPPIRHRIDVSKAGKLMPLPPSSVSLDQTRRDYEA